jgi:hypothetical protein
MRLRTLTAAAVLVVGLTVSAAASVPAEGSGRTSHGRSPFTFAVIGDIPYGARSRSPTSRDGWIRSTSIPR